MNYRIEHTVGVHLDKLTIYNNISTAYRAMLADRYGESAGVTMPLSKILSRIMDNKGLCYTLLNERNDVIAIFGALPVSPAYPQELQLLWEGVLLVSWAEFEYDPAPKEVIEAIGGALKLVFDNGRTNITLCTQIREDFTKRLEQFGVTVHRDKKEAVNGVNYVYCSVNGKSIERLRQYLYPVAEPQTHDEVTDDRHTDSIGNKSSDWSDGTPADQEESQQGDISDQPAGSLATTGNQDGGVESGSGDAASAIPIEDARP